MRNFIYLLIPLFFAPIVANAQPFCSLEIAASMFKPTISTSRKFPIIDPTRKFAVDMMRTAFQGSDARTREMWRKHGELSSEHIGAAEENLTIAMNLLNLYGEQTSRVPVFSIPTDRGTYLAHGLQIDANPNLPLGDLAYQLDEGRLVHFPLFHHRMNAGYAHDTQTLIPSALAILLGRATPEEIHELGHRTIDTMNDDGRPSLFHGAIRSTDGKPLDLPSINRLNVDPNEKVAYFTKTGLSELYTYAEQHHEIGVEYLHALGMGPLFNLPKQEAMAEPSWFLRDIRGNSTPFLVSSIIADASELFLANLAGPEQWQRVISKLAFGRLANPKAAGLKITIAMRVKNVEIEMDFVGPGISDLHRRFQPFAAHPTSAGHQAIVREIIESYLTRLAVIEPLARRNYDEYQKLIARTAPENNDAVDLMLLHLGLSKPRELIAPYLNYEAPIEHFTAP